MDEPSAASTRPRRPQLHEIVRSLAEQGTTVLLISHFLREVLELADSVTVLRDGKHVRTAADDSTRPRPRSSRRCSVAPLTTTFPPKRPARADAPVALAVRDLHAPGVADVSFEVRAGEIVGLAGPGRRGPNGARTGDLRREPRSCRAGPSSARSRSAGARAGASTRESP